MVNYAFTSTFGIPAAIGTAITVVQTIFTVICLIVAVIQVNSRIRYGNIFLTDVKGPAASNHVRNVRHCYGLLAFLL